MTKPMDDLPDDMLDMASRAANEFGFNKRQENAMEYIQKGLAITGVENVLTDDFWLREVIKDIHSTDKGVRSKALAMLGKFIGALQAKGAKPGPRKVVEFEE